MEQLLSCRQPQAHDKVRRWDHPWGDFLAVHCTRNQSEARAFRESRYLVLSDDNLLYSL